MSMLDDFSAPAPVQSTSPANPLDEFSAIATGPTAQHKAVVTANDNADEAARALKLGKTLGVPATVVQSDVPGYGSFERTQSAKRATENPAIEKYVNGNPIAASVSNDDWSGLDEASVTLQALHPELFKKQVTGGVFAAVPEVAALAETPQGRQKLLSALYELPKALGQGILDFFGTPGKTYKEGASLEQEIGFGVGVALGTGRISAGRPVGLEGIRPADANVSLMGNEAAIIRSAKRAGIRIDNRLSTDE